MYLLSVSHSLNQAFRIANTAVDQNVAITLNELKGFKYVSNTSTLNIESTNINVSIEIDLPLTSKLPEILKEIEVEVSDNIKTLIGKKPSNVQILVVKHGK